MGFLDSILGNNAANQQSGQPPVQGSAMLQSVLALIHHQSVGGLGGLIQKFQSAGLGHLVSGWVSKGPNPPVSPDQVHQALGNEPVQQFAQQNNLPLGDAKNLLAQLLPHVVDHLTPNGNVPQQPMDMGSMLSMLKQKLM
jgi:uncharacterized protein YidB (DUF937 family)